MLAAMDRLALLVGLQLRLRQFLGSLNLVCCRTFRSPEEDLDTLLRPTTAAVGDFERTMTSSELSVLAMDLGDGDMVKVPFYFRFGFDLHRFYEASSDAFTPAHASLPVVAGM